MNQPWAGRSAVVLTLVSVSLASAVDAGSGQTTQVSHAASVRRYVASDGIAYQAVMLKAAPAVGEVAHQHVILVDTSASQTGQHRQHALEMLETLLAKLPAGDRVRIVAVDVAPVSLNAEFAAPNSDDVATAIENLKARVPLGVTDLPRAVNTAAGLLADDQAGSIVYIGDGVNTADILVPQALEPLVEQLRDRKIAVHSYGVGPQLNLHLLGILAHQTGGVVHFDSFADHPKQKSEDIVAERAGQLANAVSQPVFRPVRIAATAGVTLLPASPLPLRADRETIYLVRGDLPAETKIDAATADKSFTWTLAAPTDDAKDAFLAAWSQRLLTDGPLANSLAGQTLLDVAQADFTGQVSGLVNYGKEAVRRRDGDRVQQVIDAVRRLDPQNEDLAVVEKAAQRAGIKTVSRLVAQEDAAPPEPDPSLEGQPQDGDLESRTQPDADANLLDVQQRAIRIQTQKLRQQVSDTINAVRRLGEPELGLDMIDRTLNAVRAAIEIEPEVRAQLQKQLASERLAQVNRQDILSRQKVRLQERQAQLESQARLAERLELDEDRLENLIDRVRALMEEGRHGDDASFEMAESVATVAWRLRPNESVTAAAFFSAEAALQLRRSVRLRFARADQFLETLHQVELSHIPFPDEPPVRFPPAAVWQALTERRRKWNNVDLRTESPNENRIRAALEDQTEISFTDTSLSDALSYIEDLHNIEIEIMKQEIEEDAGSWDGTVNLELSGIKLRNALYLMLDPMDLTYVIDNEVMKITTENMASTDPKYSKTRVYPVADLVVPIRSGGMMGGMGGGMGGMMGGMGGMGGGMGGMGMGGMGGMGMGGMGMGGFSVPPEKISIRRR